MIRYYFELLDAVKLTGKRCHVVIKGFCPFLTQKQFKSIFKTNNYIIIEQDFQKEELDKHSNKLFEI